MEHESGAMDLPDPDMFLTVHGIIREGSLLSCFAPTARRRTGMS